MTRALAWRVTGLSGALLLASLDADMYAQSVQDLRFDVQELKFDVRDLSFGEAELSFSVDELSFRVEELSVAEVGEREIRFQLSADVLFDFDSAELRPEAAAVLRQLVDTIQAEFPDEVVRVEGHTDSSGDDQYNQELSERRAESVARWFVEQGGLAESRVMTRGFGESRPVAPNSASDGSDDPVGQQQNRRVEVVVERAG